MHIKGLYVNMLPETGLVEFYIQSIEVILTIEMSAFLIMKSLIKMSHSYYLPDLPLC